MRNNLARYRLIKEAQLSPAEQVLHQNLNYYVPKFLRAVVTDSSLELAQIAVNSWKCSEQSTEDTLLLLDVRMRDKFVTDLVAKAKVDWGNGKYEVSEEERYYAKSLGCIDELDLRMEKIVATRRKKLVKLLELKVSEEDIRQVASDYKEKALQQFALSEKTVRDKESSTDSEKKAALRYASQQYEKSIKYWRKALRLLKLRLPRDQQTARLSFEYGKLLFEQWDLHEEICDVLRESLEIEQALNPCSEETGKTTVLLLRVLIREPEGESRVKDICTSLEDRDHKKAMELIHCALETLPDQGSNSLTRNVLRCYLAWIYSYTGSRKTETAELITQCLAAKEGPDSEYTALSFRALGNAYFQLYKLQEAEEMFRNALKIYQKDIPNALDYANTIKNLGKLMKIMKSKEETLRMYQDALAWLRTHFPMSEQVVVTLRYIFDIKNSMKMKADFIAMYRQMVEIYEIRIPHSRKLTTAYEFLGEKYAGLSDDEREIYLRLAWETYQRDFPNTELAVKALCRLGEFYHFAKRFETAISLYQETLKTLQATYPTSQYTAEVYKNMSYILRWQKQPQEAEQKLLNALEIYQKYYPTTFDAAEMLVVFGDFYAELKRFEEAEAMYQRANAIIDCYFPNCNYKKTIGEKLAKVYNSVKRHADAFAIYQAYFPTSKDTANTSVALADQYMEVMNYEYAEWFYQNALAIYKTNTRVCYQTIDTLTKLGRVYQVNQRFGEAETVLLEAVRMFRTKFAKNPVKVVVCHDLLPESMFNLGNLYYILSRFSEAEIIFRELLTCYEDCSTLDRTNSISGVLLNLGNLCYSMGRMKEAEVEYQKALKLYKAKEPNSPNTAMTLFNLGKVYEALSRTGEAIAHIESAVAIWKVSDVQKVKELAYPSLKPLYTVSKQEGKLVELAKQVSLL